MMIGVNVASEEMSVVSSEDCGLWWGREDLRDRKRKAGVRRSSILSTIVWLTVEVLESVKGFNV
jgi:hypothetical protein